MLAIGVEHPKPALLKQPVLDPGAEKSGVLFTPTQDSASSVEEPVGLTNLSPSRASDFKTCPRLYKFRHVERIRDVPTPAQARGTAIHLALERLFEVPSSERHPERLLELYEVAWDETLRSDDYRELFAEDSDGRDAYYQAGRKVAEHYFQIEDPRRIEPLDREKFVTLLIDLDAKSDDSDKKLEIRGIIDRLDAAADGELVITDYKTGKAPPLNYADSSFFALKIYALMIQEDLGRTPAQVRLLYLGNSVAYSQPISQLGLRAMKQQLQALWYAIDRAIMTDTFPTRKSRLCNWCSYQPICPAWEDQTSSQPSSPASSNPQPVPLSPPSG